MVLLDELSGFEFEETMALVFEKMGYRDVQVAVQVADEGRDIIMTEPDDVQDTTVVVECKHTATVSRPDIQKLDSAVRTYDGPDPKKGMIATTGRLTAPAREYAETVDIEILDGQRLRGIALDLGMDLYNGRIELICEEGFNPLNDGDPGQMLCELFEEIDNIDSEDIPQPNAVMTWHPVVVSRVYTAQVFSTSVGPIHVVDEQNIVALDASGHQFRSLPAELTRHIYRARRTKRPIDKWSIEDHFEAVNHRRFELTETEYRQKITEHEARRLTTTVHYTGNNNVNYEKRCSPDPSNVRVRDFDAMFVPRINAMVQLGEESYEVDWYNVDQGTYITDETVKGCRVCEDTDVSTHSDVGWYFHRLISEIPEYTYCQNCSRVVCPKHLRIERNTGEPVCTACSVRDTYVGAAKYFYDEASKASFDEEYATMGPIEKLGENRAGVVWTVLILLFILVILLL